MKKRGTLSTSTKNSIKRSIEHGFKDWQGYQVYLAEKLDEILDDSQKFGIDSFLLKLSLKRYLRTPTSPITKEEKQHLEEARISLTAVYVMILYHDNEAKSQRWHSIDQLLNEYPHFQGQSQDELQLLLQYRNIVRATLLLVPAARNKRTIMAIAGRLQGKPKDYVTGGGQKEETRLRVEIYEHEGGVFAQRRPDRQIQMDLQNCETAMSSLSTTPCGEEMEFFHEQDYQLRDRRNSMQSDASTVRVTAPVVISTGFGISSSASLSDDSDHVLYIETEFEEFLNSISDDDTDLVEWNERTATFVSSTASTPMDDADDEFEKVAAATGDESLAFSNRNSLRLQLGALTTLNSGTECRYDNSGCYVTDTQYGDISNPYRDNYISPSLSVQKPTITSSYVTSVLGRRERSEIETTMKDQSVSKSLRLTVDPTMFDDDIPDFTPRFRDLLIHIT